MPQFSLFKYFKARHFRGMKLSRLKSKIRKIKMPLKILFQLNREIKVTQNIVFETNRKIKMPQKRKKKEKTHL